MAERVTSSVFDEGFVTGHHGTQYAVTWDHPVDSIDYHLAAIAKVKPRHPDVDFLLEVRAASAVRLQQALCVAADHIPDHLLSDEGRARRAAASVSGTSDTDGGRDD